jgi:hypothetical protein
MKQQNHLVKWDEVHFCYTCFFKMSQHLNMMTIEELTKHLIATVTIKYIITKETKQIA